jgi:hypothetical protein
MWASVGSSSSRLVTPLEKGRDMSESYEIIVLLAQKPDHRMCGWFHNVEAVNLNQNDLWPVFCPTISSQDIQV